MPVLATAVIGLGYWGPNLARNIAASPRTKLVRLCDFDQERVTAVGRAYPSAALSTDVREVMEDSNVDAVAIATPVSTHHALAKEALIAGKHVLLEKPMAATTAEALDLIATASEQGLVLLVDHVFVYSPAVQTLIELCRSGSIGDIKFIDSVRINLGLIQHDVNVLWDLAPHDLSIIDSLIGRAPLSVVAVGESHVANGTIDVSYMHLDYGGIAAAIHLNWLSPVKIRHLMVGGSKKSVLYNDLDRSEPVKVYDRGVQVDSEPEDKRGLMVSYRSGDVLSPRIETFEPLTALIAHFADCVEQGVAPITGGEQGLRIVQTLEAADRSLALDGARVEVSG
jgi:predicted dehydrogenase